jgi:hypothetical protein
MWTVLAHTHATEDTHPPGSKVRLLLQIPLASSISIGRSSSAARAHSKGQGADRRQKKNRTSGEEGEVGKKMQIPNIKQNQSQKKLSCLK